MPRIDSSITRRPVLAGAGLCLLLAACGDGGQQQPVPAAGISMDPAAWAINSQTPAYGMSARPTAAPGGGWQVYLPVGAATVGQEPSLHSVLQNVGLSLGLQTVGLKLGSAVTVVAEVQASADAAYWFATEATNPQPSSCPVGPHMRILLQRAGDNLSGQGDYQWYRWWARIDWNAKIDNGIDMKAGAYTETRTVALNPANWISVWGNDGSKSPDKFAEAMANIGSVGLTFGGGCAAAHGLRLTQGSSKVIVRSFTAE